MSGLGTPDGGLSGGKAYYTTTASSAPEYFTLGSLTGISTLQKQTAKTRNRHRPTAMFTAVDSIVQRESV